MSVDNINDNKRLIEEDMQKREHIVKDIYHSIFVEAGAGAGKTSLVVERILNQLVNGVAPENIVVITFTNKAAEELRSRIVDKFMERRSEIEAVSENYNINHMTISTIHSFCHKMLSERIFDAGLKPDARLIKNEEEARMKSAFFNSWYARLSNEELESLTKLYNKPWNIKASVYNMFDNLCTLSEEVEVVYDPKSDTPLECSKFEAAIDDFKDMVVDTINAYYGTDFETFEQSLEDETVIKKGKGFNGVYTSYMKKMLEKDSIYALYKELCILTEVEKCGKYFTGSKAVINEPIVEPVSEWIEAHITPLFEEMNSYIHTEITDLALRARSEFWQSAEYKQTITNDTILKRANKLVCENKSAWEYFSDKYKYIYVDEFQDTDDIQSELVWQLARRDFESDDKGLRDGALFIVGDPKQSIYRFRAADVTQYFSTKDKMQRLKSELNFDNVDIYELNMNFRSNPEVINWVNQEFCTSAAYDKEYSNMLTEKASDLSDDKCLQGVYRLAKAKNEPNELCDIILKLTNPDNGFVINVYDKQKKTGVRPIEYRDIMILTNGKETGEYASTLADRGIPTDYTGRIGIATVDAVKKFAMLFSCLVTPKDKRARCGAVNSLREVNACTEESVQVANAKLDSLFTKTSKMDSYGKALFLARHIDLLLDADTDISANEVISIQKKLRQITENVFSEPLADNYSLVKYLNEYINGNVEHELLLSPDANVIRFMNVHQAKGLEANIVIVAQREKEIYRYDSSYRDNTGKIKKYYPIVKLIYYKDRGYTIAADMDTMTQQAHIKACRRDMLNLQYVAATRAREALLVMGTLGKAEAMTFLEQFDLDKCCYLSPLLDEAKLEETEPSYREYVYPTDNEPTSEQTVSPYICVNPSSFEESGTVGRRKNGEDKSELETEITDETVSVEGDDRPKGNILGNVMHRSYELFINRWKRDFTINVDNMIKICVNQALIENSEDIKDGFADTFRNFVEKTIKCFTQDEEMTKLVKNADKIYTELEFSYMLDKEQARELLSEIDTKDRFHYYDKLWVNGTADLVLVAKDGSVVIADYKSDGNYDHIKGFKEELNKKYQNQLLLYRYAMAKLLKVDFERISTRIVNYENE